MATIHLCSINGKQNHIGTVYTMTVKPVAGYPNFELFAPTPAIVYGHKHFKGDMRFEKWPEVSDEEYRDTYRSIIYSRLKAIKEWYGALREGDELTLCCYCPQGKFCHRLFVESTLKWLNRKMGLAHTIERY